MRADTEMKFAVADIFDRDTEVFTGRRGIVAIVATIEPDKAICREVLPEEVHQGIVIRLRGGGIVFGVPHESFDRRMLWQVFHVSQPAATADHQLDLGVVWQGEVVGDGRLVWGQRMQCDARRKLVARHQDRRGFSGQKGHEAHAESVCRQGPDEKPRMHE